MVFKEFTYIEKENFEFPRGIFEKMSKTVNLTLKKVGPNGFC